MMTGMARVFNCVDLSAIAGATEASRSMLNLAS